MRFAIIAVVALLVGCGHSVVPTPPPVNHGTIYSIVIHPNDPDATSAAGLANIVTSLHAQGIRVDYDPAEFSYAWVPTAIADGLKIDFITPYIPLGTTVDQAYITAYATMCAALVAAYPGQTVELQNEPNNQGPLAEEQLTPAQYVQLMSAVVPAIRAADSTATVITGGTSVTGTYSQSAWLTGIGALLPLVDGVAVHPYGVPPSGFALEAAALKISLGRLIYFTEWGESPQVPASIMAAVQDANGVVPRFDLYEYENQPGETTSYGIVGTPAFAAYAAAIASL